MTTLNVGEAPKNNPCAQCGAPIPTPDWIEAENNRLHFVWNCELCNYRFQCTAIYPERNKQIAA